ncbi:MAG: toprim domain-containing protein, partial [Microcystaceae cyanobacterium]
GLWVSHSFPDDRRLVICESPLDCLSYHQLFPDGHTRYFATGGPLSEKQKDLLRTAFERIHAKGGEIVIATDKDAAGQEIALELKNLAPRTAQFSRVVPRHQKDWNEALQAKIAWEKQQSSQQQRERGWPSL